MTALQRPLQPSHGKCILVTGGSRGIGGATARQAGRLGYDVVINYRRAGKEALEVVADIEAEGGRAMAVQADVGNPDEAARLFKHVDRSFGRLDVLVNNAGILTSCRVEDTEEQQLETVFRTNVFGVFFCSREAVTRMSTARGGQGGTIINVSSVAARLGGQAGGAQYAASKGAVDAFTLALAKEVALEGIRVNGVRPGLIHTEIHESQADAGGAGIARRLETVPLKRAGSADEVAECILWLCSNAPSYVHGTMLDVSGGR